jgi:2-oxoisovalerate dehydrogenase E1 component alpha subunit
VAAHSTADDPSRYRPKDESEKWPLGDPIERLKQHLIALDAWSDEQHAALLKEIDEQVRAAGKEAEALGTLDRGPLPPVSSMFDDVYKEMPWYLQRQRDELGV